MSYPVAHCGTYSGYQAHGRRGEEACDPCKRANREYARDFRERRPELRERDTADFAAHNRATRRLREMFRAEFDALYREEKGR